MENLDQNVADKIPGIDDELPDLPVPDELTSLKEKADFMGVPYHPSIGVEKLRAKVAEALAAEGAPRRATADDEPVQAHQAANAGACFI